MKRITPGNIRPEAHRLTRYAVEAERGTTLQDVMIPGYWGLYERFLRYDFVIVIFPDTGKWAEFIVTETGQGYTKMTLLQDGTDGIYDIPEEKPEITEDAANELRTLPGHEDYAIRSVADGWAITQKGVRNPLYRGLSTEEEARKKLIEHLHKVAGTA